MSIAKSQVAAKIDYLLPTGRINHRFWAPGEQYNTGLYTPYDFVIRDARLARAAYRLS